MKKYVFILIFLMVVFCLSGCSRFNEEKTTKLMEEYFTEKYGEEIIVTDIQVPPVDYLPHIGEGIYTKTGRGRAMPKNNPEWEFKFEFTKDLTTIWDLYLDFVMKERYDEAFNSIANDIFDNEFYLYTKIIDHGPYALPDPTLTKEEITIENYDYYALVVYVHIKQEGILDAEKEKEKINKLAEKLIELGIRDVDVALFYLPPEEFAQSEKVRKEIENLYDYYRHDERMEYEGHVYVEKNEIILSKINSREDNFGLKKPITK